MGRAGVAIQKPLHVFVNDGVTIHQLGKRSQFLPVGKLAVDQQIRRLDEGGFFRKLLDRNSPVAQYPFLSIEKGNRTLHRPVFM